MIYTEREYENQGFGPWFAALYRKVQSSASQDTEREKGGWRMPRLLEAKKGAASCEKPRLGASGH